MVCTFLLDMKSTVENGDQILDRFIKDRFWIFYNSSLDFLEKYCDHCLSKVTKELLVQKSLLPLDQDRNDLLCILQTYCVDFGVIILNLVVDLVELVVRRPSAMQA